MSFKACCHAFAMLHVLACRPLASMDFCHEVNQSPAHLLISACAAGSPDEAFIAADELLRLLVTVCSLQQRLQALPNAQPRQKLRLWDGAVAGHA